jgi:hypothetical protein
MIYRNLLLALSLATSVATISAQTKAAKSPDTHPDLTGLWSNATRTPVERTPEFASKPTVTDAEAKAWEQKDHDAWQELDGTSTGPLHSTKGSQGTGAYNVLFYDMGSELMRVDGVKRTSMVMDPPEGRIPAMLPAAVARNAKFRNTDTNVDDVKMRGLSERCIITSMSGPPMLPTLYNNNYQILQTPDAVMIMVEEIHDARIVRMNAKHAPANVRQWMGDSVGHWEGDTLVVETTNFTPDTHFRGSSENLKVTERFTRVDDRSLLYKATMEDSATWSKPWSVQLPFAAIKGPIYEYACHEGNYAIEDILGGARRIEQQGAEQGAGKK